MTAGRVVATTTSVLLWAAAFIVPQAPCMQNRSVTLDQILQRLEQNLQEYDSKIPSFFCDEHLVSEMFPGRRQDITVADSIFRVKRVENPDHSTSLAESRELKGFGAPSSSDFEGPAMIEGAFEGGLAVVSASQQACMEYDLEKPKHGTYVIRFKTRDDPPRPADCLLQEKAHGQVSVDAVSMQITRLELITPHHTIGGGQHPWYRPMKGEWVVTAEYAPVTLDGKKFWMPANISSRVTSDPNTFHSTTWLFKASYRNFHKLEVTSRVVPQ